MRAGLALLVIAGVASLAMVGLLGADAHPGHVQKTLFNGRWYNAATMELSTSKIDSPELFADCATPGCMAAWTGTIQASVNDWNFQSDTANFVLQGDYNINYDINTWAFDNATMESIFGPGILGIAIHWDSGGFPCDPNACTYYYGDAIVNHDLHAGAYGTAQSKQATMSHELGHLLSLCHESVAGDCHSSEGVLFACGSDDSGPVPTSIMAYRCIDPPVTGGAGLFAVQPWDVCGVNHAYPDPVYGFTGCPATPTPTPPPTPVPTPTPTPVPTTPTAWGNVDCGGGIGAVDALKLLRFAAGLAVSQTEPCPDIGTQHPVVLTYDQGDVDCSGAVTSVDALKLLRFSAALSVSQTQPCPVIGVDP